MTTGRLLVQELMSTDPLPEQNAANVEHFRQIAIDRVPGRPLGLHEIVVALACLKLKWRPITEKRRPNRLWAVRAVLS